MLSSAIKHIQKKFVNLTHYIPCVIIEDTTLEEFIIGPVRFMQMRYFLKEQEENFIIERERLFQEHIKLCQKAIKNGYPIDKVYTPEQSKEYVDWLVDTVIKNFASYSWVSEVMIPECDKKTSILRAEMVIEGALNILRLMLGENYSKKLERHFHQDCV